MIVDQDGNMQPDIQSHKRRGRPKGSKNKKDTAPGLYPYKDREVLREEGLKGDEPIQVSNSAAWVIGAPSEDEYVTIRLQSEQVPGGLEATVSRYIAVAVSALPNGNASVITNIGSAQPLILVTVEPYLEVRNRFFPGLK